MSTHKVLDFCWNNLHPLSSISLMMRAFFTNCAVTAFNHFLTVREEIVSMSQQTGIPCTLKLWHAPERLEMLDQVCLRSGENWSSHIHWLSKSNWMKRNTTLNGRPGSLFEVVLFQEVVQVWEISGTYCLERERIRGTHPLMFKVR